MITFPNAKINLGLNIVEKRPDGYHNLETIFYPINLQDALEVTRRENNDKEYTLHISGALLEGEPEDNLVVKAYKLLKKDYPGLLPVDIHMYKHIPAGAGLGGGSSDAACMIKLLNDKFSLGLSTEGGICGKTRGRLCFFHSEQTCFRYRNRESVRACGIVIKGIPHNFD